MCRGFILILISLSFLVSVCYGQVQGEEPAPTPVPTPKPYEEEEFPQWLRDLRRAEVIMIGAIPFTFFFSIEIFDSYRYVSTNFNSLYAPWPFKGQAVAGYEKRDKHIIIITAVSLSACIAIADYIIIRITRGKKYVPKPKK